MVKFLFLYWKHIVEPLGIMYLSAALKKAGHDTKIAMIWEQDIKEVYREYKPDVIAGSIMTGGQAEFSKICGELKAIHPAIAVMGGVHVTFHPTEVKTKNVDIVAQGEAEEAIVDLADALRDGKDYTKIANLWVKKDGKVHKNEKRPLVEDLDSLGFPDREIAYEHKLWRDNPIKHFIAGRGCPYKCTYCFNHAMVKHYKGKGAWVRWRSPEHVVAEVKDVVDKYGAKMIYFQDDTFNLNKPWVKKFAKVYKEQVGLPFHAHIRANVLDEEMAKYLSEANCYSVHMAIECGNDRIRNEVLKRYMTRKQIYDAVELCHKYDIKMMLQNMVGLPTSTLEDDMETLRMNIESNPTYAWVSIFQPYPGVELTDFAGEKGLLTGDYNAISAKFFDDTKLKMDKSHKRQVEHLQKWFAVAANHPIIYKSGALKLLINAPDNKIVKKAYAWVYKKYRDKRDKKLYGIDFKKEETA